MCRFLGVAQDRIDTVPPDNSRPFVGPGLRTAVLGQAIRAGATVGAGLPPQVWRRASRPLVRALPTGGTRTPPKLASEQRQALVADCADDIARLEQVLGQSFEDWRSGGGRGSFAERQPLTGRRLQPARDG